jgi:DNA-binding SARP family transcriptional activator
VTWGPLVVQIDGGDRSPGGPRPAAALAVLLINANRRVTGDALREAMWGDAAGDHAAATLETHMFRLRKVIEPGRRSGQPPVVISEPGGYRLVVSPDRVDSVRFALLAADATSCCRPVRPIGRAASARKPLACGGAGLSNPSPTRCRPRPR